MLAVEKVAELIISYEVEEKLKNYKKGVSCKSDFMDIVRSFTKIKLSQKYFPNHGGICIIW